MIIRRRRKFKSFQIVDVTPMADIVFLLLIFFMLSSTFIIQPGIKIKLPEAATSEIQPEEKLVLSISKNNKLYLNDRRVKSDTLVDEIKKTLANRRDKLIILKADKKVAHGVVVDVLDKAKIAGANKLAIATEKIRAE